MMPEEWPIAARVAERNAPARTAGSERLATVRVDFFLDPSERLTEQERALMTAMLHCLVGDIASELRAGLPPGWTGANDDEAGVVEALTRAGLLDEAELVALLLRRADEERIGSAARARLGRRDARVLQGLVSHENGGVSAAAMALIIARGRRRDRFGQCLLGFDDLPQQTAERLVHAVAAALRRDVAAGRDGAAVDNELNAAASALLSRHDRSRSIEALTRALIALLEECGGLDDELLLGFAHEGEVGLLGEALGRRAGIGAGLALDELLSGDAARVMRLLGVARFTREVSAGILASIGDLLGIEDAGSAIVMFDRMSAEELQAAESWLRAAPSYRAALQALGAANG